MFDNSRPRLQNFFTILKLKLLQTSKNYSFILRKITFILNFENNVIDHFFIILDQAKNLSLALCETIILVAYALHESKNGIY